MFKEGHYHEFTTKVPKVLLPHKNLLTSNGLIYHAFSAISPRKLQSFSSRSTTGPAPLHQAGAPSIASWG